MNEEPQPLPPPDNNVQDEKFKSHLDPFFSSSGKEPKGTSFTRWGKDDARSALATTRHSLYWTQGIIGVSSPVAK